MNSYLPPLLVILCFGPWITAREVYQRYTKNSVAEVSSIKPNADGRFPIINGLVQAASQAKTWVQWLRRLLKALRKWCASHPQEVKLGKCFAKYFNIKIPGLRQHEKLVRDNDDVKQTENQIKLKSTREIICGNQRRIFKENFPGKLYLSFVWDFIGTRFRHYRDILFGNELLVCGWDYFWKKFWTWIDSAPDCKTSP